MILIVARDTNRGHSVQSVCNAFQVCKDCGFNVVVHMMPDFPNMGFERDIEVIFLALRSLEIVFQGAF